MLNIPIPEYCTLGRASKLLDCEISDLIHFGEIGVITICIKVPESTKGWVHIFNSDEDTLYDIENNWSSRGAISEFVTVDEPLCNSEPFKGGIKVPAFISGLWGLLRCSEYGKPFNEIPCDKSSVLKATDRNFFAILNLPNEEWGVDEIINIDPENMYILGSDIEKLIEFKGKRFKQEDNDSIELNKKVDEILLLEKNEDSLPKKTLNTRAQFIKSLLYIHYGNDVAESPRRFMEGKDSVILDDFKNKGIIPPSGKAVQDWLKFTEIPFKSQE